MNNLQYIVKDNTRFAMHVAVELCEQGDFNSPYEAIQWLMQERDIKNNASIERTCRDISVDSSKQFYCSLCECTVDIPLIWGEVKYCPNCGAKVVNA